MSEFALWSVPVAGALAYAPHAAKVGILRREEVFDSAQPRADVHTKSEELDKLVERLGGSHANQLEMLGPYAAGVAAATAVGVAPKTVTRLAALYVGSRCLYNVAYAAKPVAGGKLRSAAFTLSLGAMLGLWVTAARSVAKK